MSGNFSDVDGTLSYSAEGLPAGLTIDPTTGIISGTIDPNASDVEDDNNGTQDYSVTVTATDDDGESVSENFTWTVNNVDPEANNDAYTTDEDKVLTVPVDGVLDNDVDGTPDSDPLSVISNTDPTNGTVTQNADGSFEYTPNLNFNGVDTFNYTISDGNGGTDTATVTITVNPVNDASIDLELLPDAMLITDDGDLEGGNSGDGVETDTDTKGAGTLFNVTSSTGTLSYALELGTNTNTNLVDVATDESVNLSLNGGVIEGRTGTSDDLVFTISVDSATGEVTQTQLRAVEHTDLIDTVAPYNDDVTGLGVVDAVILTGTVDAGGDIASDSIDISGAIKFTDDGPELDFQDLVGSGTDEPQTGFWNGGAGADGADSLEITLDGYTIGVNAVTVSSSLPLTDISDGNYTYAGLITDDFDGDGENDEFRFDLIVNADGTYVIDLEEGFTSTTTVSSSVGTVSASGPFPSQQVDIPDDINPTETIVFTGVDDDISEQDIKDFILGNTADEINNAVNTNPNSQPAGLLTDEMNLANGQVGVNNQLFNDSDQQGGGDKDSMVIDPLLSSASSFDINITANQPFDLGESMSYKVFYDNGTVENGTLNGTGALKYTIEADPLIGLIDAVQLTMEEGTVKIGSVSANVVTTTVAEPVSLDFSAVLTDLDGDSASDGDGGTTSSGFTIDLLTPIAENDSFTVEANEDNGDSPPNSSVSGNLLTNDFNPGVDPLTVINNTSPTNGLVSLNANGNFTYTPNPGFPGGTDSFEYTISDGASTSTATVDINIVNPGRQTTTVQETLTSGDFTQTQELKLITEVQTANTTTFVEGFITTPQFQPPFNIGIVIDVSGSTVAVDDEGNVIQPFSGVGDVNNDGISDTILDAEIKTTIELIESIIEAPGLDNSNVDIGLITFSTSATLLEESAGDTSFSPADPNDPTKINPVLFNDNGTPNDFTDDTGVLVGLTGSGWTNFDDALDKSIDFFDAQLDKNDATNLLFFESDGLPNRSGDGDNPPEGTPDQTVTDNDARATAFDSELNALDMLNVQRNAIGVGSGSEVSTGSGLDKIDNTPDPDPDPLTGTKAEQVLTTDALRNAVLANPVVGTVIDFQVSVNGEVQDGEPGELNITPSDLVSGPLGYSFGSFVVDGLDPSLGASNQIVVTTTLDLDGDTTETLDDQVTLTATNEILGKLPVI